MILQSVHLKGKAHPELCASGHVVLLSPSYQQVKEWEDAPRINTRPAGFLRLSAHEGFQQSLLHGPPRGKHWLHRGQSGKPSVCTQLTCSKSRCRSLGGTLSIPREPSGSLWGAGRLRGDGQEGRGAAASKERGAGEGRLAGQMGGAPPWPGFSCTPSFGSSHGDDVGRCLPRQEVPCLQLGFNYSLTWLPDFAKYTHAHAHSHSASSLVVGC